jgi:hypothetical protein
VSDDPSKPRSLRTLGVVVGLAGAIGCAAFGWQFGGASTTPPLVIGVLSAAVAVVWTLARHRQQ